MTDHLETAAEFPVTLTFEEFAWASKNGLLFHGERKCCVSGEEVLRVFLAVAAMTAVLYDHSRSRYTHLWNTVLTRSVPDAGSDYI
jgi:hypothetical protein